MEFKRGDTFYFSAQLPDAWPAGNWSAKCTVRDFKRRAHVVETRVEEIAGKYVLYLYAAPALTSTWAVGPAKFDVEFKDSLWKPHWKNAADGLVRSSITKTFVVIEDVTS